jgi:hypothetical protein
MEGLTQLVSGSLFSNNGARSFVATQSADYTTSPGPKNDFGKRCHENTGLSEIITCIGLTESLICQIRAQPVALLHDYLWRASKPFSACFSQESDLAAALRPRRNRRFWHAKFVPHRAEIKK